MKQLFAFGSGFGFHFVYDFFEVLGRELAFARGFIFKNFVGEAGEDRVSIRPSKHFGVVGRSERGCGVVIEDK